MRLLTHDRAKLALEEKCSLVLGWVSRPLASWSSDPSLSGLQTPNFWSSDLHFLVFRPLIFWSPDPSLSGVETPQFLVLRPLSFWCSDVSLFGLKTPLFLVFRPLISCLVFTPPPPPLSGLRTSYSRIAGWVEVNCVLFGPGSNLNFTQ